jgi:hypothetical protein
MPFAFGRVDAIAGLGSEMYFMLVPVPLRRPCGGHSRSCLCKLCQQDAAAKAAFRRRSDRVSMSAVKSARYSIKITENWPKGLCRPSVYRRTMWRFQVAAIAQLKLAAVLMRMEHVFDFHSRFLGSRSRDGFGVGGPHRMPLRPPLASGWTLPQISISDLGVSHATSRVAKGLSAPCLAFCFLSFSWCRTAHERWRA